MDEKIQEDILDELTAIFKTFESAMDEEMDEWLKLDIASRQAAISSGNYPLIAYAQHLRNMLNAIFNKTT